MRIPWRDSLATLFVALAMVIYAAWAVGRPIPGFASAPAIAVAVLVLGIASSMSAVVPGFVELLHGSRPYLASASVLGLVALLTGVWCLVTEDPLALAALVLATALLWAMSTARHLRPHGPEMRLGHR